MALIVHQVALDMVVEIKPLIDRVARHDRSLATQLRRCASSTVLNIAEGNGRFTPADHARFLGLAHAAVIQSAATLDLSVARHLVEADNIREGRRMLERMAAMLTAMVRKLGNS